MLDVARNADGRLEVFGVNAQGHIWHTWQTAPNNLDRQLGRAVQHIDSLTSLRVVPNADGRLEVFGVNAQGHIGHTWQTTPNGNWIGSWAELYTNIDSLAMLMSRQRRRAARVFGSTPRATSGTPGRPRPTATGSAAGPSCTPQRQPAPC